jgi:hypothetical protein
MTTVHTFVAIQKKATYLRPLRQHFALGCLDPGESIMGIIDWHGELSSACGLPVNIRFRLFLKQHQDNFAPN